MNDQLAPDEVIIIQRLRDALDEVMSSPTIERVAIGAPRTVGERRSVVNRSIGAAACVALVLGGVWVLSRRDATTPTTSTTPQSESSSPPAQPATSELSNAAEMLRLRYTLTAPDFEAGLPETVTSDPAVPGQEFRAWRIIPDAGFLTVSVAPTPSPELAPTGREVPVSEGTAWVSRPPGLAEGSFFMEWHRSNGETWTFVSTALSEDDVVGLASSAVSGPDGSVVITDSRSRVVANGPLTDAGVSQTFTSTVDPTKNVVLREAPTATALRDVVGIAEWTGTISGAEAIVGTLPDGSTLGVWETQDGAWVSATISSGLGDRMIELFDAITRGTPTGG